MKYAVIATGGKQYRVQEGDKLEVELLGTADKTVTFSEVLLVVDGEAVNVGTPTVPGVTVTAELMGTVKGEKIEVFKYKSKSRYRKHTGHRQQYSQVKITAIGAPDATPKPVEKKATTSGGKNPATRKPAVKKATKTAVK